jgi:hypothetical protein
MVSACDCLGWRQSEEGSYLGIPCKREMYREYLENLPLLATSKEHKHLFLWSFSPSTVIFHKINREKSGNSV